MSWESYINDQLLATKVIKEAIICGYDGNVWASSDGAKAVTHDDIKLFISNFNQPGQENFKSVGVTFKGEKFMYLSSNEKVARFKKGTSGVHTIKTTQAFIICWYKEPTVPEQAASVTEKLGDYLIQVGY
jgi:profilin